MSPSARPSMKLDAARRALAIFAPLIEPEVSTTRATSRGARCVAVAEPGASTQRPR
ncbi:MAG: hypothetical protein R3A52_29740 [Polyangiales bacterium]